MSKFHFEKVWKFYENVHVKCYKNKSKYTFQWLNWEKNIIISKCLRMRSVTTYTKEELITCTVWGI